jgi:hypothetical protein
VMDGTRGGVHRLQVPIIRYNFMPERRNTNRAQRTLESPQNTPSVVSRAVMSCAMSTREAVKKHVPPFYKASWPWRH